MGGGPGWGQDRVSVDSRLMSEREAEPARNVQAPGRGQGHQSLATLGRKSGGKYCEQENLILIRYEPLFRTVFVVVFYSWESRYYSPQRGFCWPFLMTDSDFYSQPLRLDLCLDVCLVSRVGLGLANEYCIQWECVTSTNHNYQLYELFMMSVECRWTIICSSTEIPPYNIWAQFP